MPKKENHMKLLKPELLRKIDIAKSKLDQSKIPNFIGEMFRHMQDQTIENTSMQDGDNRERRVEVIQNFKNAWEYGMQNCPDKLDFLYLTEIAGRVEPTLRVPGQTYADFRKEIRQFLGGYVPPADRGRIVSHLERMEKSEEIANFHPVERAIFDYFHLIRIQPFFNGNKRTSGIVMNTSLRKEGFLPISISNDQVPDFESYLIGAIDGFRELGAGNNLEDTVPYLKPDFKQLQFYDFLGRKELCALTCAENNMAGLNAYTVSLRDNGPSTEYALKHKIRDYFKARGLPSEVRLDKSEKEIKVIGEIPMRTLELLVSKTHGVKNFSVEAD